MTIANGSFEQQQPGGHSGVPEKWTISVTSTAEEWAEFALNPSDTDTAGNEGFERGWTGGDDQELDGAYESFFVDIEPAFFDSGLEDTEDFENGWGIGQGFFELSAIDPALFDDDADELVENFEDEWPNPIAFNPFDFGIVPFEYALFDGEQHEDFEESWDANESHILFFVGEEIDLDTAVFDVPGPATTLVEGFEAIAFQLDDVTVDPATDTFTRASHGLSNGDRITFSNLGGRLPDGILASTRYFVRNSGASTLQVSATLAGAIIDVLDNGYGEHFINHDPTYYWTTELVGV